MSKYLYVKCSECAAKIEDYNTSIPEKYTALIIHKLDGTHEIVFVKLPVN